MSHDETYSKQPAQLTDARARRAAVEAEIARCSDYLYWRFAGDYCFSYAKLPDPENPGIERTVRAHMPTDDEGYHRPIASALAHPTWKRVAFEKSRQMQATWEVAAYLLHYIMFNPKSEVIIVSKKEEDTDYIISDRMSYMWENQPDFLKQYAPVEFSYCRAAATNGAWLKGIPQGEGQSQQYQCNIVYFDECAWNDYFFEMLAASMPMASRIICTSTANGRCAFRSIVKDELFNAKEAA